MENQYKNIFKSTFLFSFVQIIRMLMAVVKNKIVAMLLGPSGMGIISIYNNMISFVKTGAGLGVAQSAVRDVSEANAVNDRVRFSKVISITNRVVLFTALLGFIITVTLSPLLSKWGFGDSVHIWAFVVLAFAVAFDIFVDNQLAILKGMRHLRELAKASVITTFVALATGIPLIYFFKEQGIVPSIVVSAFTSMLVSIYYIRKIDFDRIKLTLKETISGAKPMIKVGVALMLTNFLSIIFDVIVLAYIRKNGGLADVGCYGAASTLVITYFSLVTTSLTTDYYPRVAAVNSDNAKLSEEIYRQSLVGLILILPLAALFVFLAPLAVNILYTNEFLPSLKYTDVAIWGVMFGIVSNCLGYILIAKQESKIFLAVSIVFRCAFIPIYLLSYSFFSLTGLGAAYSLNVLCQLIVYAYILKKRFKIIIHRKIVITLLLSIILLIIIAVIRQINNQIIMYSIGFIIVVLTFFYAFRTMKYEMGINMIDMVKNKISGK